jgi:hypothetical protein
MKRHYLKASKVILVTLLIMSCKINSKPAQKKFESKALYDKIKEPFISSIPDSLKHWIPIFDSILHNDQLYRSVNDLTLHQKNSSKQKSLDSSNQIYISRFLDTFGYPKFADVGLKGSKAINLVLQHSPLTIQIKYYPLLCEALKKRRMAAMTFAMFEDRLNLRLKRRQVYGTQAIAINDKSASLYPLFNLDSTNSFRSRIGITQTIEEYVKYFFKTTFTKESYYKNEQLLIKQYEVNDSLPLNFMLNGFNNKY